MKFDGQISFFDPFHQGKQDLFQSFFSAPEMSHHHLQHTQVAAASLPPSLTVGVASNLPPPPSPFISILFPLLLLLNLPSPSPETKREEGRGASVTAARISPSFSRPSPSPHSGLASSTDPPFLSLRYTQNDMPKVCFLQFWGILVCSKL